MPPPIKNVLSSFDEQDKLFSERLEVSQRWSLYLFQWTKWTSISDSDTRVKVNQFVRKIGFIIFLKFKIILKVKVNQTQN